jgi:hypothetical protein
MKYLLIFLFLISCIGPQLFNVGGVKVTAGTVITAPAKIEAYEKYKEEKEKKEYKEEEHKKRFEVNKINETTFEIYY